MPLTSDPEGRSSFESEGLVRFPMFDGDRMVPCSVRGLSDRPLRRFSNAFAPTSKPPPVGSMIMAA
jgi:hypothetical protein